MKTKKIKGLVVLTILALLMMFVPGNARALAPLPNANLQMYADEAFPGEFVPVKLPLANIARLCPENALGPFDAVSGTTLNEKFFALASRNGVEFTFPERFMNVEGNRDIEFAEVTWGSGNTWHVEAVLVYLTDAYIRDGGGNVVPYVPTAGETHGYFAGIAWNRTGIQYVSEADRLAITASYLPGVIRDYGGNSFEYQGEIGISHFSLPDEVVDAEGIYLVDITKDVYAAGGAPSTYETGTSVLVTEILECPIVDASDVTYTSGQRGNTDGFDLDAIRVYRSVPERCETAWGTVVIDGDPTSNENNDLTGITNWGWNIGPLASGAVVEFELWAAAGQNLLENGEHVGNGTITYAFNTVTVEIEMFEHYRLNDLKIWVGSTPMPLNNGRYLAAPGQFDRYMTYPRGGSFDTEGGTLTFDCVTGQIYVGVHADVCWFPSDLMLFE